MGRSVLSVLAGIVAGVLCVFFVEMINTSIYPFPSDIDFTNKKDLSNYIKSLPTSAHILGIIAHAIGAFLAGLVAGMVSRQHRFLVGLISGLIILVFAIMNILQIPSQTMIVVSDIVFTLLAAFIGAKIGSTRIVG